MTTNVTQDKSITVPQKRVLIAILTIAGIIAAWFITDVLTKNSLYHQ